MFSTVLVDLNDFSSISSKVQHSHSRHYKTTSNLITLNSKDKLKCNNSWPLEGAMYITRCKHFRGHPEKNSFMQFSQNIDGFRRNY